MHCPTITPRCGEPWPPCGAQTWGHPEIRARREGVTPKQAPALNTATSSFLGSPPSVTLGRGACLPGHAPSWGTAASMPAPATLGAPTIAVDTVSLGQTSLLSSATCPGSVWQCLHDRMPRPPAPSPVSRRSCSQNGEGSGWGPQGTLEPLGNDSGARALWLAAPSPPTFTPAVPTFLTPEPGPVPPNQQHGPRGCASVQHECQGRQAARVHHRRQEGLGPAPPLPGPRCFAV